LLWILFSLRFNSHFIGEKMPSHEPMSLTTIRLDEIKPSNLPNPSIKFYYFSGFVCANANTTQSWRLAEEVRSSICSVVGSRCPVAVACCSAHVTRFPSRRLPQSWNLGQHLFPNRSQRTVASRSRQARERERRCCAACSLSVRRQL
jgi:hypothetical protein